MKEALERKPEIEQRKQELETRKQAVGERVVIYIAIKRYASIDFTFFSDFFDFF